MEFSGQFFWEYAIIFPVHGPNSNLSLNATNTAKFLEKRVNSVVSEKTRPQVLLLIMTYKILEVNQFFWQRVAKLSELYFLESVEKPKRLGIGACSW